jgi:hypothetical protein
MGEEGLERDAKAWIVLDHGDPQLALGNEHADHP